MWLYEQPCAIITRRTRCKTHKDQEIDSDQIKKEGVKVRRGQYEIQELEYGRIWDKTYGLMSSRSQVLNRMEPGEMQFAVAS